MLICAIRNVRRTPKRTFYTSIVIIIPILICGFIMASLGVEKANYSWLERYTGGDILIHNRTFNDVNDSSISIVEKKQEQLSNIKGIEQIQTNIIKTCSIF